MSRLSLSRSPRHLTRNQFVLKVQSTINPRNQINMNTFPFGQQSENAIISISNASDDEAEIVIKPASPFTASSFARARPDL